MREEKKGCGQRDDSHILDWSRIIPVPAEKQPQGTRSPNKGILFEDMIEKLLMAMFPDETWRRTPKSHDGKRDFVYPSEEYLKDQKWAECKNYHSNLSINAIAPTLIMGVLENIGYIFFFSYSPLNDNALDGILRYSRAQRKTVGIFDGIFLESLICKYYRINGIATFFPGTDFEKVRIALHKTPLRIVKTLRDLSGNQLPSTHRFELGEAFYIRMTIQNLTWAPVNCQISFHVTPAQRLRYETNKQNLVIPFAGIEEYSVICEALRAGNTSVVIKIAASPSYIELPKFCQRIEILDEPFLAWSGQNAFEARDRGLAHLMGDDGSPLIVYGKSGTGKSTLLEIFLRNETLRTRYNILRIDLTLSRNCCVRNLFSQIVGVRGTDDTPQDQMAEDEQALALLTNSYAQSAAMLAETILRFYDHAHPYLFVIDDAQKITRPYIDLLQELDDRSVHSGVRLRYVLSLNEEETSLDELLIRLNWDLNKQNQICQIELKKFGKTDILGYLKTGYGLEDIDGYFEEFEKDISPLELHNFCSGLKEKGVIIKTPSAKTYQIVDHFRFSDGIQHILYADFPLKVICDSLDKNGISDYILKYLYVTDKITPGMERRYSNILQDLMRQGILREKGGSITFYHNEVRRVIRTALTFSEEDYADIFGDHETDYSAKAICALEQLERLKGGREFLKDFFISAPGIKTVVRRYSLCQLVFQRLDKLAVCGLSTAALYFVRVNFDALREEQGYTAIYQLLTCAVNSALVSAWDTDEKSVEYMAYFIKKFFDRTLSTHNEQNCLQYFEKYEVLFAHLVHISDSRRNFWLSHYANRAAIALDRASTPLEEEPSMVKELYKKSKLYCANAGDSDDLRLQISVDDFNRHYVYRHDLTVDIVNKAYKSLLQIKHGGLRESIVLDYHVLLLEYLRHRMGEKGSSAADLLKRIRETYVMCASPFYTLKLYMLEIYILTELGHGPDALALLPQAFALAYKKEMRWSIYKLTYIKVQLTAFQAPSAVSRDIYEQSVLALEQLLDTHRNAVGSLKREMFLLVRLAQLILAYHPDGDTLFARHSGAAGALLQELFAHLQGTRSKLDPLFYMCGYFTYEDVSFPTI